MYLLNGQLQDLISVTDRGFQYGDGVFETIEVLNGIPLFFDRHLARLLLGCQRLLIPAPDTDLLKAEAAQFVSAANHAVLKLVVTRGSGGRGYRAPLNSLPTRLLSLHPYPDYPLNFQQNGVHTRLCKLRLGNNPALSGIKHLNRLEQILARAEWQDDTIQEGLLLDDKENLIEGTMSNVFIVKSAALLTPDLTACGVKGIVRDVIIDIAKQINCSVLEKSLSLADLYAADEVFLTNSIIGIWPVRKFEHQQYNLGKLCLALQAKFNAIRIKQTTHA